MGFFSKGDATIFRRRATRWRIGSRYWTSSLDRKARVIVPHCIHRCFAGSVQLYDPSIQKKVYVTVQGTEMRSLQARVHVQY